MKENEARNMKKGTVRSVQKPFAWSCSTSLAVYWQRGGKLGESVVLDRLKPLPGDRVLSFDDDIAIVDRKTRSGIAYLDGKHCAHMIHGAVPYCVEAGQEGAASAEGFWKVAFPVDQDPDSNAFRIRLEKRFDMQNPLEREKAMVRSHFDIPDASPEADPDEISRYREIFEKQMSPENLAAGIEKAIEEKSPSRQSIRYDLRNRDVFTIDDEGAQDLDDAIEVVSQSENRYLLGIHIADVASYVEKGSFRDQEASSRGASCYLADTVLHMLPECLSRDLCSLLPREDRLCVSVYAVIETGEGGFRIKNVRVAKSVIESKRRFSYKEVENLIKAKNGKDAQCDVEDARLLGNAARLAKTIKIHSPYKDLYRDRSEFVFHENDRGGLGCREKPPLESKSVIEMFMVTANRSVGRILADMIAHCLPKTDAVAVYRAQPAPARKDLKAYFEKMKRARCIPKGLDFETTEKEAHAEAFAWMKRIGELTEEEKDGILRSFVFRQVKRSVGKHGKCDDRKIDVLDRYTGRAGRIQNKADLTTNVAKSVHCTLGIGRYAWFTSPIRRYADIVNHRAIRILLFDDKDQACPEPVPVQRFAVAAMKAKKAQDALDRRLLWHCVYCRIAETKPEKLEFEVVSFDLAPTGLLTIDGIWQKRFPVKFGFDRQPLPAFSDYGLSCELNKQFCFRVGETVEVRIRWEQDPCIGRFTLKIKDMPNFRRVG